MPRPQRPFIVEKRNGSKSFLLTLHPTSGLPDRICREWYRKSFQNLPVELALHYNPKTKAAAEAGAMALIAFLKNGRIVASTPTLKDSLRVGEWLRQFTSITESPKGARLVAENRPYSAGSVDRLKTLYNHMNGDPFLDLLMSEVESADALMFMNRMGLRKLTGGRYQNKTDEKKEQPRMMGTETFSKMVKFLHMAFKEYGREHHSWYNPFQHIDPPKNIKHEERDALPEEEVLKLFAPGVLQDTMELAVCSAMFLAGLRRSEVFALRTDDLDWRTPKINVRHAWQNFSYKRRIMGPPKGKKPRIAPFDKILQAAIKKLWEENGKHDFVFCFADGKTPGPSWIKGRFNKWISRAGINVEGLNIVPHSSRHSLASMLEERGESLRHIQELLGHVSMKTTKRYLHSTDRTIRNIGLKIDEAMKPPEVNL